MKNILGVLFLSILSIAEIEASCWKSPDVFMENIRADHIIFYGTIIQHLEIPYDSEYYMYGSRLTMIKVHRWYQNEMGSDTIYCANGDDNYVRSLRFMTSGQQIVGKAIKNGMIDPLFDFYSNPGKELVRFMEFYKNEPIIEFEACDENILSVENEKVIGNITKNYRYRRWKRISFIRRISKKWAEKLESRHNRKESKYQEWSLERFARYMTMKWNSL